MSQTIGCTGILLLLGLSLATLAQDEPKPKPRSQATPASPVQKPAPARGSLLVSCDLACVLTVDGQRKHKLPAGGATPITLGLGEHLLDGETLDGQDHYKRTFTLQSTDQTIIQIQLEPIQNKRLQQEKEELEKQEQKRRWEEIEEDRNQHPTWTDPATGLMWTKKDSYGNHDEDYEYALTWDQAVGYCHALTIDSHSDWRLPTIDELASIYEPSNGHFKGNLLVRGWLWSATRDSTTGDFWGFDAVETPHKQTTKRDNLECALCVRP
jgi:hypothetical protein